MRTMKYMFLLLVCVFFMTGGRSPGETDRVMEGKMCFTQTNIWYEDPQKIYSTNYHVGTIIPVGTKVQIVRLKGDRIQFKSFDTGRTYKMPSGACPN